VLPNPVSYLESVKIFLSGLKTAGPGRKTQWGKDLAARYSVFNEPFLTASARAMMKELFLRRKVRCHKDGLWKSAETKSRRTGVRGTPQGS
jgi:hypothetical protein